MNTPTCYIQLITSATTFNLELDGDIPFEVNLSRFDARDISKKQTSHSKNIPIPNTPANNIALGQIWNINATTGLFDINVKNKAILYADNQPILKGYLQLTGIKKTAKSDSSGDQLMYYQGLIFDDVNGFLDSIEGQYLTEIDLSRFDHTLNYANITGSSANTWNEGYYYNVNYKDGGGGTTPDPYLITDFKPSIFAKTYMQQMIGDAGYTTSGSTMESEQFKSLVIPFNGTKVSGDNSSFLFQVCFSADASTYGWTSAGDSTPAGLQGGTQLIPVRFDSGVTGNLGSYNIVSGLHTAGYSGHERLSASWTLELGLQCVDTSYLFGQYFNGFNVNSENSDSFLEIIVNLYAGPTSNTTGGIINQGMLLTSTTVYSQAGHIYNFSRLQGAPGPFSFAPGITKIQQFDFYNIIHDWEQSFGQSTGYWVEAKYVKGIGDNCGWYKPITGGYLGIASPRLVIRNGYSQGFFGQMNPNNFRNSSTTDYVGNTTLRLNDFIPRNLKKKDLVIGLTQMFNLFWEPDPLNEGNIFVDTRDLYYSAGTTVDWSQKLAIDQEIDIKFLSELQNSKKLDFTWADDTQSDYLLRSYKENNNLTYGELIININNQFLSETREIRPVFAMTPTAKSSDSDYGAGWNIPVPYINCQNPNTTVRILSRSSTPVAGTFEIFDNAASSGTTRYMQRYNWAGEYDNPYTPRWSLNWSTNKDSYYDDLSYVTLNDLYNSFYYNYVRQIANGKVVIAKFYLKNSDLANFRLNTKIWVDQFKCYFVVNAIKGFNPVNPGLTTVELIKYES